jgi:hypothetical protein
MEQENINSAKIPERVVVYDNLFKRLLTEVMKIKNGLDFYQTYLHRINSVIQLSVIFLSVMSTFAQAINSKNYEILFTDVYSSSTNITINESINVENTFNQDTYSKIVPIITLSISTYSALVITAERHFSFEEREGNVSNLKGLYAELISRIKYYRELLEPWKNPRYYIVDQKHKLQEWNSFYKKLESEYAHIIDIKRELYTSYEKILNVRTGWRKGRSEEAPTTSVSVNEDNSQP